MPTVPPSDRLDSAEALALLERAREFCYFDIAIALEAGHRLAAGAPELAADGWLHVALAEIRGGTPEAAAAALAQARAGFATRADAAGADWCDEVEAIGLRRAGEFDASARLQAAVDQRRAEAPRAPDALYEFVGHNSRAITAKLRGDTDGALRHFYAADEAARRTGHAGPQLVATGNLGSYHHDLHNLDDARRLCEAALGAARTAGARQTASSAAANLITIYFACGEPQRAYASARYLLENPDEVRPRAAGDYPLELALAHYAVGQIDAALDWLRGGAVAAVADGDGRVLFAWIKARCLLALGQALEARVLAEETLAQRRAAALHDQPYDMMQLHQVLADACERLGDHAAALACLRAAHARYELLVGRSARARYIALEVGHRLVAAQRERDLALDSQRAAEVASSRLAELNSQLEAKVAQVEALHQQLREQALRDPLTSLHNRRYLFEVGPGLLELARRQERPLVVALLDLDHFKLLNDTYGHAAGDLVLQRFAAHLQQTLRKSDVICRHGGEEFVAVMPDIEPEAAQAVLERLLESWQDQPALEIGRRRLPRGSFSAGLAHFPRHGHTLDQLLLRADRGLYAAKNQGRARVELAPGTGFGTLV